MKYTPPNKTISILTLSALAAFLVGCASSGDKSAPAPARSETSSRVATKFKADDGRTIEIGKRSSADGGWAFKEPHMDKCWIADGLDFTGYDGINIAPTLSTAKLHNDEEIRPHQLAKENLPMELERVLHNRGVFPGIVLRESDIKPGAKVLRMENTIIEYAKGGGGARYFVGLYGGGQPILRLQGKMIAGDKAVFTYEARRSGVSAGARMGGAFMKDEDIQIEDIRSFSLDLADFVSAISGKFQPR